MALRRSIPILASLALVGVSLAATTASAHPEHGNFVTWQGPSDTESVAGDAVHIKARVSFGDDGVQSWAVEVLAPPEAADAYPGYGTICERTLGGTPPTTVDVDCVWNTTMYAADGAIAHNGNYVVRVTARNGQRRVFSPSPEPHVAERPVKVTNPTSPPSGVKLSFSEGAKQATLRWSPNPEPDVVRYVVQEKVGSEAWQTVGETGRKVTTFTRRLGAPGTYRYQVAALRASGERDQTVASPWAAPSGEPKQVVVAEPPKPSSTTSSSTSTTGPGSNSRQSGSVDDLSPTSPDPAADPAASGPGAAPAEGSSAPAAASGEASAGGPRKGLITPIAPGGPGSIESHKSFSGNVVEKGAAAQAKASAPRAPQVVNQPDGPYSDTLPYPKQEAPAPSGEPEAVDPADEEAAIALPVDKSASDVRAVVVPLAGGLLLFVFAMLAFYVNRRSSELAALDPE